MQNYNYDNSSSEHFIEDKKIFAWNTNPYQLNFELKRETPSTPNYQEQNLTRSQLAHLRESPAARERRLARNAERMREKRARESDEERRRRLDKNALNNRLKRLNESPTEKAIRQVRDAARQRLRRAMESQDQRESRLRKLAERMRQVRRNETPEKKTDRLTKAAQRARERLQRETSEERRLRLQKGSDYARRVRSKKSTTGSSISNDTTTSDISDHNPSSSASLSQIYQNPVNNLKIPQHHHQQQPQQQQQQQQQQQHQQQHIHHQNSTHMHYDNSANANNYNFVNFNNSISALAFNDAAAAAAASSSLSQPTNNSLITLNIPHYHTVFSQTHQTMRHQQNATVIKEEFYPKMANTCDNMNQLKQHLNVMKIPELDGAHNSFQNHIKVENNVSNAVKVTQESEIQRLERLRKAAELSRLKRINETPEQRSKRLNDTKERARKRRDQIKQSESDEERKIRLARQAEYARHRRQKDPSRQSYQRIGEAQSTLMNSEKPSVLKILEPIIEMNTDATTIETLCTFDTEYPADSVEFYNSQENIFAVGTYQLANDINNENVEFSETKKTKSIRKGRIFLFKFEFESDRKLEKLQQLETDAILDQKWLANRLFAVSSLGNLDTYVFNSDTYSLNRISSVSLRSADDEERLALSVDVDRNDRLLVSDSCGQLSLIDASSQVVSMQFKAHDFEAWSCAFDRWNPNTVYSGGDDSCIHVWDLRHSSCSVKTKMRDAGVTSFLNHQEFMLFAGSYDERLSLYDMRNFKRSVDEINLMGGIWRIKQSPIIKTDLLVACMYHNFSVVDCTTNLRLIGEYNEHESICYGCDFSYSMGNDGYSFFATCSFYDHRLSVCRIKHNVEVF